jgi:hypothetical protein
MDRIGGHCSAEAVTVLWQKGLKHNPENVTRSHRNLLSRLKIKSGGVVANVPWTNICFHRRVAEEDELKRPDCSKCERKGCVECLGGMPLSNIKAVHLIDNNGGKQCEWFVAFKGEHNWLTRIPTPVVKHVTQRLSGGRIVGFCSCGTCEHPLLTMKPTTRVKKGDTERFDEMAVGLFTCYRKRVRSAVDHLTAASNAPEFCEGVTTELGECAICFEECDVSRNACVSKRCSLPVCKDCHAKTMGLCPICDREKINGDTGFYCQACGEVSSLEEYAFACSGCSEPVLCSHCYRMYGQCNDCIKKVHDKMASAKRARKE